jgi:MFS family permease
MTTRESEGSMRRLTPWLIGVGVVTFLAGLLFGYDQGVISGALPLIQDDLGLSTIESEIITSWVTLGALFGALVAGWMADRRGGAGPPSRPGSCSRAGRTPRSRRRRRSTLWAS